MRPLTSGLFTDPNAAAARRRLAEVTADGSAGRPVALRGFNISGAAKNRDNRGLPFSLGTSPDIVSRAADFLPDLAADGFDLLRIPIVWEFFEANAGAGAALRDVVAYAGRLGFRVIIDIHQDLLSSYFCDTRDPADTKTWHGDGLPFPVLQRAYGAMGVPQEWWDGPILNLPLLRQWAVNYDDNATLQRAMRGLGAQAVCDAFQAFAGKLAGVFRGLDNVLTYEVINEPYSKCVTASAHLALASAVLTGLGTAVARDGRTPTWSVMPAGDWLVHQDLDPIPHLATSADVIRERLSLPGGPLRNALGPGYWLLTPHFYDPHAGAPPGAPFTGLDPTQYEAAVAAAARLIDEWDVVPIVGEFGVGSNKAERIACHRAWIDAFERRGWSWCLWNFNPDAGPAGDDGWCGEKLSITERVDDEVRRSAAYWALLRPFPRFFGGPLLSGSWDGTTWRARVGRAYQAGWRTEIYVPKSLGAFGVTPECQVEGRVVVVDSETGEVGVEISVRDGVRF
jgi:hypothetical protein